MKWFVVMMVLLMPITAQAGKTDLVKFDGIGITDDFSYRLGIHKEGWEFPAGTYYGFRAGTGLDDVFLKGTSKNLRFLEIWLHNLLKTLSVKF